MRGHAPQREGLGESGVENAGSMKKKQTVQKGGPCCKTASVRAGQNDEPRPTADVGKPKKKEKRSMDANPAPVKDWKGGDNEHKKMGVHEGIRELEKLLNRKIDTTFLEGDVDEAWDLKKAEKAGAAKSRPVATGGIKKAAAKGRKGKNRARKDEAWTDAPSAPVRRGQGAATGGIRAAARGGDLVRAKKARGKTTQPKKGKADPKSFWSKAEEHM